jgi:hypothetical protein
VVERPRVGNRCLYTHCYWRLMLDKNRDRTWLFRGFYMIAPPVSVKNREVDTREQVLNVPITCR